MTKLMTFLEQNTKPKIRVGDLADKLGVHPTLIIMWRNGTRRPGRSRLRALSKITKIAVNDLL